MGSLSRHPGIQWWRTHFFFRKKGENVLYKFGYIFRTGFFLHSKIADRTERASDKSSKLEVVLYTTLTSY